MNMESCKVNPAEMEGLRKGIEEAAKQFDADTTVALSEIDRFRAAVERQREGLRKRMLATESRYEVERTELIDGFRVRLRNLEHEAAEALRAFESRHAQKAIEDRKLADALEAARGELSL